MTYTIEYTLDDSWFTSSMEHVAADQVAGVVASIEENEGRVTDIIAERDRQ